jgi:DNA-binding HxlR family transcriptional regulator
MLRPTPSTVPAPDTTCPGTLCVDLLQGAWTPHVLWYLRGGARRFGDLKRDLDGVTAKVLTERLRTLEERGMVSRTVVPTTPASTEYALTDLGRRFIPVLDAIVALGREVNQPAPSDPQPHLAASR